MKTTPAEFGIQMPESSSKAENAAVNGQRGCGSAAAAATLRTCCAISSAISLSLIVTSEQRGELSAFGLEIPLHSDWSYSDSLQYLVGVSAAATAYSVAQLLLIARKKMRDEGNAAPSRCRAWILFVGDQAFAYTMISAGSAAAGVSNLNRTGVRHAALPNFCKPLPRFCDHMAISVAFAFLSFLFLAISSVLDVLWLANY